jgi:hypothetical protein
MTGEKLMEELRRLTPEQRRFQVMALTEHVTSNSAGSDEYHEVDAVVLRVQVDGRTISLVAR